MFARVLNTPLYFDESFMIAHLWKKTFHEKQVKKPFCCCQTRFYDVFACYETRC